MEIRQFSKFDATVTSIFKELLESYPAPRHLDATVVGYKGNADNPPINYAAFDEKAYARPTEDEFFFADIVRSLATQHYLMFENESACTFSGVVVTRKWLSLWAERPDKKPDSCRK